MARRVNPYVTHPPTHPPTFSSIQFKGRNDMLEYAAAHNIQVEATTKKASYLPTHPPKFSSIQFKGRNDLLEYAAAHNIQVEATKKASYSVDENLYHTSYESGMLEDPMVSAPPTYPPYASHPIHPPLLSLPTCLTIHLSYCPLLT